MRTRWLGQVREHHALLTSTNDHALRLAQAGAVHGTLVTADAQTAGRGRMGRRWDSPAGAGIYASIVLRPDASPRLGALGLAVGVGLRRGLASVAEGIGLKWPNDLMARDRKLAGILCEARWSGARPEIVAGFGIDVEVRAWPPELAGIAISLAELRATGEAPARDEVLGAVLVALEGVLDHFFADGFAAIWQEYVAHTVTLGRRVSVADGRGGVLEGVAEAVDEDGALVVRTDDGRRERVLAGELEA